MHSIRCRLFSEIVLIIRIRDMYNRFMISILKYPKSWHLSRQGPQAVFSLPLICLYLLLNVAITLPVQAIVCEGVLVNVPGLPPSCEFDSDGDEVWDSRDKCPGSTAMPVDDEGCHETQRAGARSAIGSTTSDDSSINLRQQSQPDSKQVVQTKAKDELDATEQVGQLEHDQEPTDATGLIVDCGVPTEDQDGSLSECVKDESHNDSGQGSTVENNIEQHIVSHAEPIAATHSIVETDLDQDGITDELDVCPETAAGQLVDEKGCPKGEKIILNGALFGFNSSDLSSDAKKELQSLSAAIKQQPELRLNIFGFTDSTGSEDSNLYISQQRAQAVASYLVSNGVAQSQITLVQGLGSAYPRAPNLTTAQRAMNRRVEIEFIGSQPLPSERGTTNQTAPMENQTRDEAPKEVAVKACDGSYSLECEEIAEVWVLPLDSFTHDRKLSALARAELKVLATALTKDMRSIQTIQLAVQVQGTTQTVDLTEQQKEKVITALKLAGVATHRLPKAFRKDTSTPDNTGRAAEEKDNKTGADSQAKQDVPAAPIVQDNSDADADGVIDKNDLCLQTLQGALVGTDGCLIKQTYRVAKLLFLPRSSTLTPEGELVLKTIADSLKYETKARVEIAAFTDNRGSFDFNLEVSQNRANVVAEFLRKNGVSPRMIFSTKGYGSMNPIASNFDEAGRRANERIELNFIR